MADGLERAPILPGEPPESWTGRSEESAMAFQLVEEHDEWIREFLRLDANNPYQLTDQDLQARQLQQRLNRAGGHFTARGVFELGSKVLSTVAQMEGEFRKRTVLDIGAGEGRFGEAIARNAKAKVTFLDNDPDVLRNISPRAGEIVEADGRDLPFEDESFDRVMCAFSTVHWASNPVESARAINEALRVTKTEGSAIFIPLLSNLHMRHQGVRVNLEALAKGPDLAAAEEIRAQLVWAAQDHVLIKTIVELAKQGYCAVTWSDILTEEKFGIKIEHCSAIVDKLKPIPPEFFQSSLEYAGQLMPKS